MSQTPLTCNTAILQLINVTVSNFRRHCYNNILNDIQNIYFQCETTLRMEINTTGSAYEFSICFLRIMCYDHLWLPHEKSISMKNSTATVLFDLYQCTMFSRRFVLSKIWDYQRFSKTLFAKRWVLITVICIKRTNHVSITWESICQINDN